MKTNISDIQSILDSFNKSDIGSLSDSKANQRDAQYRGGKTVWKKLVEEGKVVEMGKLSATKQWKENREGELKKCSKGGKKNAESTSKETYMCDLNDNIIMTFKNRKDAAKYVNGFASTLTNILNHPTKTYKGYKWKG